MVAPALALKSAVAQAHKASSPVFGSREHEAETAPLLAGIATIRRYAREEGREPGPDFEVALYYNINVNEDYEAAYDESKRFLDAYYTTNYHSCEWSSGSCVPP